MSDIDRRQHQFPNADGGEVYYHESAVRELVEVLRNLHTVTYFPKDVKVPDHKEALQKWEELLTHYKDLPNEQT